MPGTWESKDKYLVVLGAKPGSDYLVVLATSKQKKRALTPGCNQSPTYYFIPGGGKDFFKLDTWLLLMRPYRFNAAQVLQAHLGGDLTVAGNLKQHIWTAIRSCLQLSPDVTTVDLQLL
jgi:hypothetical protein